MHVVARHVGVSPMSVSRVIRGDAPYRYPPTPADIMGMGVMPTQQRAQDFGDRAIGLLHL